MLLQILVTEDLVKMQIQIQEVWAGPKSLNF